MRVSLITLHRVLNYGSVLQTFATSELIKRYGAETVEVVDYVRKKDPCAKKLENYGVFRLECEKRSVKGLSSKCREILYNLILKKSTVAFYHHCDSFLCQNVCLSERQYHSADELMLDPPDADIYAVGSDQVWNNIHNEGVEFPFFLTYAPVQSEKIALCSSLGIESPDKSYLNLLVNHLSTFSAVSVREVPTANLLNSEGITCSDLLDPTLLYEAVNWEKKEEKCIVHEPYLLVYQFGNDKSINQIADSIAKEKKLKVIHITFHKHQNVLKNGKCILTPSVPEFLSLIHHADFIVTNSFHGTCFSINFNKQFAIVLRNQFNVRMESVVERLGLSDRIVNIDNYRGRVKKEIEYSQVNQILTAQREKAAEWISTQIMK